MSDNTDWNSNLGGGFGIHKPEDELFHGTGPSDPSLTETWFWNFHVPNANINCYAYCWVHPYLKTVTAGLFVYQGFKRQHLACEVFEMRDYLAINVIGDGSDIQLPNGMRVKTIIPLEHIEFSFDDPHRDTSIHVTLKGLHVPIMRANNQHFEQVMHATGKLVLRGQEYDVDCYPVRDRSWGELRPEDHAPVPPYTWVTGTFGEEFAFNVGAHDDPEKNPEWLNKLPTPERIFKDGWVVKNGEQRRIVSASKITHREYPHCRPLSHTYEFLDSAGEQYNMTGELIAQTPWSGWSNMICHLGLVRWSWGDKIGYGESQEVHWNEYVYKMGQE